MKALVVACPPKIGRTWEERTGRIQIGGIELKTYMWQSGNAIFLRSPGCNIHLSERKEMQGCAVAEDATYIPRSHYDTPVRGGLDLMVLMTRANWSIPSPV
jgi:hypothetical protein